MARMPERRVIVVGGGLAGSEAAWQLAERGIAVDLYEMRPGKPTGAHQTSDLAELVCSNSLGSALPDRASGVLMAELERLGSMVLGAARETAVPAGGALAVDRNAFARKVTARIEAHSGIRLVREEVVTIPEVPAVIASGPLTSAGLSEALAEFSGEGHLYFFDALSPIVEADSVDMQVAFRASRYGRGQAEDGDYINCPLDETTYKAFVAELLAAERIALRAFEAEIEQGVRAGMHEFFEGCLPIEVLAGRGPESLAYGPMRPVGLTDPRTGRRPYAVLQLRQDNLAGDLYNMVGFQTNLRFPEQRRVFRMIPGLAQARFARYGQMHRNTFLNAPNLIEPNLASRARPDLFFAGQITGVEGYLGNIATGWLAGFNLSRVIAGRTPVALPRDTMLGSLCHYIARAEPAQFQPMKANFGLMPDLGPARPRARRLRAQAYAQRSAESLNSFLQRETASLLRIATT